MWRPILDGDLRRRAERAAGAIAPELAGELPRRQGPPPSALADGYAGLAVALGYLSEPEAAADQLDRAVESLAAHEVDASLHWGLSGTGWALVHLDPAADVGQIDEAVAGYLSNPELDRPIGLMEGVAGLGLYGLERLPAQAGRDIVSLVVRELERRAEPLAPGLGWRSAARWIGVDAEDYPDGYYSLGVAHGIPGVIPLLAGACAWDIERARARRLLDGVIEWLMAQRLPAGAGSSFPYVIAAGTEPTPARAAWCYGDPGIAGVLGAAGAAVGSRELIDRARALAVASGRRDPEQARVHDAGMCHGAAGLGHILNRLFHVTGDEELRELAGRWLMLAVDFGDRRPGLDGYHTVNHHDPAGESMFPGVLSGPAGVALALTAAASEEAPGWDRMFGLSVRVPEA